MRRWLESDAALPAAAAAQLTEYLGASHAALGGLPTHRRIVFERFFDELGDMHLVIHSPFGSRVNRAWGLALRKRFCRKFNFELQAAALEDSIVLSLGPTHSFPLAEVANYLHPDTVRNVLTQALLTAPVFPNRWRWVATTALAVRRNRNGKKVPPQFQRSDAEDLLAVIFPDQLACAENLAGEREVPDHPLVEQAIGDCLHELMDVAGLEKLLQALRGGDIELVTRDLAAASPLAQEVINARPYAFLDDAPAEERRTRAIRHRHVMNPVDAAELARPDPAAIARVRTEAWPVARDPDELHDALVLSGFLATAEAAAAWHPLFAELQRQGRASEVTPPGGETLWVASERAPLLAAACPSRPGSAPDPSALAELLRRRLESLGPVTAQALGRPLGLVAEQINLVLQNLETEGFVVRGYFDSQPPAELEWCERRLLARIHRRTLKSLRKQIEPVSPAVFMRFLFRRHGLTGERGAGLPGLGAALACLRGCALPARAWERQLLPARTDDYAPAMLDGLMASGQFAWFRPAASAAGPGATVRNTPIVIVPRSELTVWRNLLAANESGPGALATNAARIQQALVANGALFFADLLGVTGLNTAQAEAGLGELVAQGVVTCDGFAGLRALIAPAQQRRRMPAAVEQAGRWSLVGVAQQLDATVAADIAARALLDRYGVVFRALLKRESAQMPPWRDLVQVLRRFEARGEVRGGRFVAGFGGEQFAWPGAVDALRRARRADQHVEVLVAGVDPLNLTGIITPGQRVPARAGNRVRYEGGVPVAGRIAGKHVALVAGAVAAERSLPAIPLRPVAAGPYLSSPARAG